MEADLANSRFDLANGQNQPPFTLETQPACTLGSCAAIILGAKGRGRRERDRTRERLIETVLPGPHEGTGRMGFWSAKGFLSSPRALS